MSEIATNLYPIPMRCITVIEKRIQKQMEAGGFLDGIKEYDREGRVDVLGSDSLPIIQPLQYTYNEEIWGGAAKTGQARGNTPLRAVGTLELFVGGRAEYGMFRRDDADDKGTGIMEWIDKLKDSIEMKEDGVTADAFLGDTVMEPVSFQLGENYISNLTLALILEVRLTTVGYYRGERSP